MALLLRHGRPVSEQAKRDLVRTWCQSAPIPFVDTVNQATTPGAGPWFTVQWQPDRTEPANYCGLITESGLLDVIVAADPGEGDAEAAPALDLVRRHLLQQVDPAGDLVLLRGQAPGERSDGAADRWYRLGVGLEYRFNYFEV